MNEWSQPRERAEWTHPRRAAKEIISYLSQVETVIDQYAQDDHSYGGADDDDDDVDVGREQLMDNILEELKHQTASIMEDRQGSVVAEKMARRLSPLQLRTMLSRCRGYMLSLANNRYSSHVLQTLLSVAGQVVEDEISGDDDADEEGDAQHYEEEPGTAAVSDGSKKIDKMQDILLSLVSELSGAWAELFADISGSHVGRGFLQVLGGMPVLSEKRGRQSRHAHSIGTAVGPAKMGGRSNNNNHSNGSSVGAKGKASATPAVDPEALEKWSTPYKHRVPRSFVAALGEVTSELEALPASELQTLACGTFGCPLLVMLLRVHGNLATATREDNPGSSSAAEAMVVPCLEHESMAMKIVKKVLQWDDEERSAQVVYAISGENTASHFLEAVMWLSPRSFFEELYHRCFESKLLEFCEHGVSNFLIQAALQRADDKVLAEKMLYFLTCASCLTAMRIDDTSTLAVCASSFGVKTCLLTAGCAMKRPLHVVQMRLLRMFCNMSFLVSETCSQNRTLHFFCAAHPPPMLHTTVHLHLPPPSPPPCYVVPEQSQKNWPEVGGRHGPACPATRRGGPSSRNAWSSGSRGRLTSGRTRSRTGTTVPRCSRRSSQSSRHLRHLRRRGHPGRAAAELLPPALAPTERPAGLRLRRLPVR
ncbi:unnamed protein product, partial [Ectocarpus sp. 8 AP-2014]